MRPVIARAEEFSGRRYGADEVDDVRFRVIADHARSGVMIIGDGVTPCNEGRGYVLRRLLRRIVRSARLLGVHEPVLPRVRRGRARRDGPVLPGARHRLRAHRHRRAVEEEAFLQTLSTGSKIFDGAAAATRQAGRHQLPGDQAFKLHDTYGFPIDLTLEMAAEAGLTVDEQGFRTLMAEQRSGPRPTPPPTSTATPTARPTAPCSTQRAAPRSSATPTWWPRRRSSGWSSTGSGCPPRARARPSR